MLRRVRTPSLPFAVVFAACAAGPRDNLPPGFPTDVPLAATLPAGALVGTAVGTGLPDEPEWRAAGVWWREALRQSAVLAVRDTVPNGAPLLRLSLDPAARTAAAFLDRPGGPAVLGGETFADGDLPAAIDRLAWRARLALGERGPAPVPVAQCVSREPAVAVAIDDASSLLRDGAVNGARKALLAARRGDGAAPAVLDGLASVELMRGDAAAAEKLCLEALRYETRLSPTVQHRLARSLLLARSSIDPSRARERDRELLALAEVGRRERPFDLQPLLSEAIARDFLGQFETARPLLERLRAEAPDLAIAAYHLGWACIAAGDGTAALANLDDAAVRLPMAWVVVPQAIACFVAGRIDELTERLDRVADTLRNGRDPVQHEVLRMQAAGAMLAGDAAAARRFLQADLRWLLENPAALERRAGEFAEQAAVLVRLGGGKDLAPLLAAIQAQHPSTAVADACAFAQGLADVAERRERSLELEKRLAHGGDSAWTSLLQAFGHEVRGEVADMQDALARASSLTDSPMTRALVARGLRRAGRAAEADALCAAIRRELTAIDLRQAMRHPVLGPELAFAWRCE